MHIKTFKFTRLYWQDVLRGVFPHAMFQTNGTIVESIMRAQIIPINGNHLSIKHAQKSPIECKSSEDNAVLQFGVRVLKTYKNGQETGIRRAILVRRADGLIAEQATTFVNRELNSLALNTQITVLWDLAFIETWLQLEALTTPSFRHPAALLANGKIPMRAGDIIKFHNWSQYIAKSLSIAVNRCKLGVAPIPNGKTVEIATTDRRLTVFRNYLVFQVENTIKGTMSIGDEEIIRSTAFCKEIDASFNKLITDKSGLPQSLALPMSESKELRKAIASDEVFQSNAHGARDRLIADLMLNAHLRAGTVSKLYMADIVERMEVDGKFVSAVLIRRRINDPNDPRLIPPAVKGKEAIITIPLRLAQRIMQYIFTYRSDAANSDSSQQLSPFLFVNLSGQFAGLPMSRENIGRVIRKLNGPKIKKYRRVYPHILRHTGLTDTANHMEECGQDEKTIRAQLLLRGTWGAKSTMPERYTAGRIQRLGAELTEKRDADLEPKSTKV